MSPGWAIACAVAAGGLFLVDLALSVLLLSVASSSRVALRRVNLEANGRFGFLEEIKTAGSAHRAAVHAMRQASLLGAVALTAIAATVWTWRWSWAAGAGFGLLVGVLLVETYAARLLTLHDARGAVRTTAFLAPAAYALTWPFLAPLRALSARHDGNTHEGEREEDDHDEDAEAYIEVGEREGILEPGEGAMVRGIMDLGETLVREIMTPRTDIIAFPADTTVAEARRVALEAGHSRFPVYGDGIDNVIGVLHVRDLLRAWHEGWEQAPVTGFSRSALFVPETRTVAELLREMRERTHLALVVDEYGGLAGLVTLEDLLEEIVGEIRDEHEIEDDEIQVQSDGSVLVNGLAHVEEIERMFHLAFEERDFDTVGGMVVASLGRVPETGETFDVQGVRVEVVEADPRRVYRVRLRSEVAPSDGRDAP